MALTKAGMDRAYRELTGDQIAGFADGLICNEVP